MSDNTENKNTPTGLEANPMPITIHTQYVRDISFENPNTPDSLRAGLSTPTMDVNISMDARHLEDDLSKNMFEVILTLSARADRGEKVLFIAEVTYGAVVSIGESVPEDQHHPILLIEIPRYLFPYARQVLSEATSSGGYPPLLLNPVDFQALYMERFKKEIEASMQQGVKSETPKGNA